MRIELLLILSGPDSPFCRSRWRVGIFPSPTRVTLSSGLSAHAGRGLGPRTWALEETLEKYRALLPVSFRPRFQEGVTNLRHTPALASSNVFQISL